MTDPAAAPPGPRGIPKAALVVVGLAGIGLLYGVFGNPPAAPRPPAPRTDEGQPGGRFNAPKLVLTPRQFSRAEALRSRSSKPVDSTGKPMERPIPESARREMEAHLKDQVGDRDPAAGARARIDVGNSINQIQPLIADCYRQGLGSSPALAGEVTLNYTLRDADGGAAVAAADVESSTLNAPAFDACMLTRLKATAFPALHSEGDLKVRYPFKLSPDQPTPHP